MGDIVGIFAVAILAFVLKGLTGTGSTSAIVGLGSLFLFPKSTIVVASLTNLLAGLVMLPKDRGRIAGAVWIPVARSMAVGSVVGAALLKLAPDRLFSIFLGVAFLFVGIDLLLSGQYNSQESSPPRESRRSDFFVGLFSGFCGGFIGVNAPPLLHHFARRFDKRSLRRFLVLIFLPAAFAQSATFFFSGLITKTEVVCALSCIPAMLLGIQLGSRLHNRVSQETFRKLIGVLIILAAGQLLFRSV